MIRSIFSAATIALLAAAFFGVGICLPGPGRAHEAHSSFSAGEPGDPKKPARVVNVKMFEGSGKMGFDPARIEVRRGEQVRFVLQNNGEEDHEFVLAVLAPWFTGPVGFVLAAPRALPFRPLRGALGFFEPASGSPIGCALSLEAVALFVRPAPMVAETTGTPHVHRRWR